MRIRIIKSKINRREILFIVAFVCFFISLFLGDIGINLNGLQILAKGLRYMSYILAFVQLTTHKANSKQLIKELAIWSISMLFFIYAKDIYLPMLIILIVSSEDSSEKHICDLCLDLLIIGTIMVVLGSILGILPDIMTAKAFSTEMTRHSYGFCHSNVLPNNLLMIEILIVWKYKDKISNLIIMIFMVFHIIIYFLSASRMSLIVGLFLTIVLLILKYSKFSIKFLSRIAYIVCPLCTILSVVLMLLVNRNGFAKKIDTIFSNRFWAAFLKMNSVGIKIFNFNSNSNFYFDGITVDNGFLFIMMRYGLIALIAINFISYILTQKYKMNVYNLICIICLFAIGFIDNLFLGYRFLPFLMLAFLNTNHLNVKINRVIVVEPCASGGKDENSSYRS